MSLNGQARHLNDLPTLLIFSPDQSDAVKLDQGRGRADASHTTNQGLSAYRFSKGFHFHYARYCQTVICEYLGQLAFSRDRRGLS